MALIDSGNNTPGKANVDPDFNMQVNTPGRTSTGALRGGGEANAGAVAMFVENDPGEATGARFVRSPEVDGDYRLRIAHDNILDRETFNYTAQNTGKHAFAATTMASTVGANGLLSNSGSITTTGTGLTFGTLPEFPTGIGATSIYCETNASFSAAAVPANVVVDIGMFRRGAGPAFAPADGAYFRFSPAGLFGVINRGGVENQVGPFPFTVVANRNYLLTISISEKRCRFWIDDVHMGDIENAGAGQPFVSATLPWSMRHANTGAAGGVYQSNITDYTISMGGPQAPVSLSVIGNRSLGSYQGLSGWTMGTLANYANSANPASSAGSNATANVTGLGGQGAINAAAAAATDFIMTSFQVPAGTTAVQGRRLVVTGVKISAVNMGAAVATAPTTIALSLAFGHTAVSLAQGESASFTAGGTTKAPRRIPLGFQNWPVGAPIGAPPERGDIYMQFVNPIYVNPGEFIATALKFINGTATASQAIWYHVTFDYGWE